MDYEVIAVNGGVGGTNVTVVLQSVSSENGTSTLNLTLPRTNAGDYVVGTVYTLSLTAKK